MTIPQLLEALACYPNPAGEGAYKTPTTDVPVCVHDPSGGFYEITTLVLRVEEYEGADGETYNRLIAVVD